MSIALVPDATGRPTEFSVTLGEVFRFALPPGTIVLAAQDQLGRRAFWARLLGPRPTTIGGEAGEIVLLSIGGGVARALDRMIEDLAGAGVVGFVVSGEPPDPAVATAERLKVPLFRIPDGAALVDAERAVISLIVDREAQVRRRVEQVYERLLASLIDDRGIAFLAQEIATVTGRQAAVLDEYFRVLATAPDSDEARAVGAAVGSSLLARGPRLGASRAGTFTLPVGADVALAVPLALRDTPAGHLVLIGSAQLSDVDAQIADRAARVLGIELAKQRAVTEAQLRLQGDFFDDLLSGAYPSEEAMVSRARWMGHDLDRAHVVFAISVDEPDKVAEPVRQSRPPWLDALRVELPRFAAEALTREHHGVLTLAIPCEPTLDREGARKLADRISVELARAFPRMLITVGAGRAQAGVPGLASSYREADQALSIGRLLLGGGRIVHFEELGVQRLLFQLRENPELAAFYDDLLGRLQAHDERQGAELVNTIEAFFENHGNHVRTAQRLHLHRNTLLYRLERARQVLGVDLDDPETRLALQVALKIGRAIGRRPIEVVPSIPPRQSPRQVATTGGNRNDPR
ncbi:MAG: helix-turn-helix domain-containing protein [Chloroflexota bacterium]